MQKFIRDIREFQTKIAEVEEGSLSTLQGKEYKERVELRKRLITEETNELFSAMDKRNSQEIIDGAVDQLYVMLGTLQEYGLLDRFIQAWDLVHANNMTKLDENGKVVKNEYGKVIKPANYKPVDLSILFSKKSPVKVLKIGIPNCKPCEMMTERLGEGGLSVPYEDINAYENPDIVEKYDVQKFPVIIALDKEGEEVFRHRGLISVDELNKELDDIRRNKAVEQEA